MNIQDTMKQFNREKRNLRGKLEEADLIIQNMKSLLMDPEFTEQVDAEIRQAFEQEGIDLPEYKWTPEPSSMSYESPVRRTLILLTTTRKDDRTGNKEFYKVRERIRKRLKRRPWLSHMEILIESRGYRYDET